jgi:ABC-type branched-subunit amino acid transport system substrate-binding protein
MKPLLSLITLCFLAPPANAKSGTIVLLHIVPADSANHTLPAAINSFELGLNLALRDFKHIEPKCDVHADIVMKTGSQDELVAETRRQSADGKNKILIGFPRSTLARLVAQVARDSKLTGISVGATTEELQKINPRFYSMAAPFSFQWQAIQTDLKSRCNDKKTAAVFDSSDYYSDLFRTAFAEAKLGTSLERSGAGPESTASKLKESECIILGMNMASSRPILSELIRRGWRGRIYGTGDWLYFSSELRTLLTKAKRHPNVVVPTGWIGTENERSRSFVSRFKKEYGFIPDPLAAYTYDAAKLAAELLCHDKSLNEFKPSWATKLDLLRT